MGPPGAERPGPHSPAVRDGALPSTTDKDERTEAVNRCAAPVDPDYLEQAYETYVLARHALQLAEAGCTTPSMLRLVAQHALAASLLAA
jgi:hypothetical protein